MTTTTMTRPAHSGPAIPAHGISFSLALDRASYLWTPQSRTLTATLALRCEGAPLSLSFAGGQEFDVAIHDAAGRQVALWSAGQAFFDHVQTISVSGEHVWTATMALPEGLGGQPPMPGGAPVRAAAYVATGWLTPTAGAGPIGLPVGGVKPGVMQAGVMQAGVEAGRLPIPMPGPVPIQPPVAMPAAAMPTYSASVGFTVHADPVVLDGTPKPAV